MESCALALPSSYTLNPNPLKQIHRNGGCRPNTKTNPTWQQSYYSSPSVAAVQLLSLSTTTTAATSSSNYRTRYWNTSLLTFCSSSSFNSTCFLQQNQIHNGLRVVRAAASVSQSSGESAKPTELGRSLLLAAMFGVWYLLNIYFNIFNKQVLKIFPYPTTVTTFQFGCATLMILTIWGLNFHPRPKIYKSQIKPLVLLAVTHTIGNLLTNISLGKVAVSFTHTIKAMEPFFTVLFSTLLLAERPSPWVVLSLIPIVSGVASASFTEASFNWIGFSSAMASNITNQSRNVLSKQFMVRKEEALDNINLFSIITIASFVLLIPSMFLLEGIKFTPAQLQSAASQGVNVKELCVKLLLSGVCFHSYQQVSYMILQMVSPVTHSVGNCVKRVVVIVSSIIFFQTPVSPVSSLGTGLALAGVFLYSRAKQIKPKPKPKVA